MAKVVPALQDLAKAHSEVAFYEEVLFPVAATQVRKAEVMSLTINSLIFKEVL